MLHARHIARDVIANLLDLLLILRDLLVVDVHLHAADTVVATHLRHGLLLRSKMLLWALPLLLNYVAIIIVVHLLLAHVLELLAQSLLVLHDLCLHVVQVLIELGVRLHLCRLAILRLLR